MPVDRDETLKKADKLLKQGKLAAAIQEYVRLVEDKPSDWNVVNALGDLYVKAGDTERAAEQFNRAADHLYSEGFFPRASAVYKKTLKVRSGDDHALWQLADIAGRNGLSLDARSHYGRLIEDRRAVGNEQGAVDCLIRLGQLEDAPIDAMNVAAKLLVERGETKQAARLMLSAADLHKKEGRQVAAFDALKEAAQLEPADQDIREKLAAVTPVEEIAASAQETATAEPPAPLNDVAVTEVRDPVLEVPAVLAPEEPAMDAVARVAETTAPQDAAAAASTEGPLPLESFFEELRGKVARDQETRAREQLHRGLEYLADDMIDEAIASLEEASRLPAMRFEAAAHLARISLGRDDLQAAVDWMERALEAPAPTVEDRFLVMYELADTLARQGEAARAIALFMEVDSESSGYRDVRERIAHLSQTEIGNP